MIKHYWYLPSKPVFNCEAFIQKILQYENLKSFSNTGKKGDLPIIKQATIKAIDILSNHNFSYTDVACLLGYKHRSSVFYNLELFVDKKLKTKIDIYLKL